MYRSKQFVILQDVYCTGKNSKTSLRKAGKIRCIFINIIYEHKYLSNLNPYVYQAV